MACIFDAKRNYLVVCYFFFLLYCARFIAILTGTVQTRFLDITHTHFMFHGMGFRYVYILLSSFKLPLAFWHLHEKPFGYFSFCNHQFVPLHIFTAQTKQHRHQFVDLYFIYWTFCVYFFLHISHMDVPII